MIIDRLGKMFEDRRKKDIPVEVERREQENKKKVGTKTSNKIKK